MKEIQGAHIKFKQINAKYLIVQGLNENTFLALNIIQNTKYILRRIDASYDFSRKQLTDLWLNSNRAVSESFISFESAGCVLSIDGVAVSKEGYFLVEPYCSSEKSLQDADFTKNQSIDFFSQLYFQLDALSYQKITHGNLIPSSISATEINLPIIRNSRPIEFFRGKPLPKKEFDSLLNAVKLEKNTFPNYKTDSINYNSSLKHIENNLQRKQIPSSWVLGIEEITLDVSYRIEKSQQFGCSFIEVNGSWEYGLDVIASEVAAHREIAGKITIRLDSEKIDSINEHIKKHLPETAVSKKSPLISFIKKNSALPLEIIFLRHSSKGDNTLKLIYQITSQLGYDEVTLVCFSDQKKSELAPDYKIKTITPLPDINLIATRSLAAKSNWINVLSNVTPLETYTLITGKAEVIKANKLLFQIAAILPGIEKKIAIEVSDKIGNSSLEETNILLQVNNRIWSQTTKESPDKEKNHRILDHIFEALLQDKSHRLFEVCWLLNHANTKNDPRLLLSAGTVFLLFWKNHGAEVDSENIVKLFQKAQIFLTTICPAQMLSDFILDVITRFYQSSSIIQSLWDLLQPVKNLLEIHPSINREISTLEVWNEFVNGEIENAINLSLREIETTIENCKTQYFHIRMYTHASKKDMEENLDSILSLILNYRDQALVMGKMADVILSNTVYASVKRICGYEEEALKAFQQIPAPDPFKNSWTAVQYYTNQAQLAAFYNKNQECLENQSKAVVAASFDDNRILSYSSILSYDIRLISSGHYTWHYALYRMDWLKRVFRYYGARKLNAFIECNLMTAHLSLLNRNTTLQYSESILDYSSDLLKGSLSASTFSFAGFAFLIGQPEKAKKNLKTLKNKGSTIPNGLMEEIDCFLETRSTEQIIGKELFVAAETLNLLNSYTSLNNWAMAIGNHSDVQPSDVLIRFRNGYLLQGYILLLIGLAGGTVTSKFLIKYKWLLKAIDARFCRAGFLKPPGHKSPLQRIINYLEDKRLTTHANQEHSDTTANGTEIFSSYQMCKKLVEELDVEKIWVIKKSNQSIVVLSSSSEKSVVFLPVWITDALKLVSDSKTDSIDLPSEGWLRGFPKPGVFIIEIHLSSEDTIFIAVESIIPGKVLNKEKMEKLLLVSGLLGQVALFENPDNTVARELSMENSHL